MSYDDQATLGEFARNQSIPYPLLSDLDSEVIRQYAILNTEVSKDDAFLYGIPFPGVYVCDEDGRVCAKFFHDTYKKRDSPESFIDAALGKIVLADDAPTVTGGEPDIKISATIHGGNGTLRQGVLRKLVLRFELGDGLHLYSEPVPKGLVATAVTVAGPPGFTALEPQLPPTEPLYMDNLGVELHVWSGIVDFVIPFYAKGELASETRPLDADSIEISIEIRYQACTDTECLLPTTETLTMPIELDVVDVPKLALHTGHGQREGNYDSTPALRRLLWRKVRQNPLGLFKFLWHSFRLELAARRRARDSL